MSPEFNSRRARRQAEAQAQLAAFAPVSAPPYLTPAVAPQIVTQTVSFSAPVATPAATPIALPQLSRREIRQQQAVQAPSQQSAVQLTPLYAPISLPVQAPIAPSPIAPAPSRRDLRDQLRQPAEPTILPVTPFAQPWSELAVTPMFQTSSGFSIDTTTNSIVLPVTPDALSAPLVIESGVTLRTGSIELPNLNAGTGSIALPTAAQIADDALSLDSASSFVSNIAPVAARNLIKKNPKFGLAPVKTKGSQGQLFYGLTTSFLMLTVGALLVVAWMYGVIK